LIDRNDEDMRLITDNFVLMFPDTTEKVPEIHNVTSNQALIDYISYLGNLNTLKRQIDINSRDNMTDTQRSYIVRFLEDVFVGVDDHLVSEYDYDWPDFVNQILCLRGDIGAICIPREDEEGEFIPDIRPVDTRYVECQKKRNDYLWWTYEMMRDYDLVIDEYPDLKDKVRKPVGKRGSINDKLQVRMDWTPDWHTVVVEDKIALQEVNPYGFVGACDQSSGLGLNIIHNEAVKHKRESIFWMNRKLYKIESEYLTVLRNQTLDQFRSGTLGISSDPNVMGPDIEQGEHVFGMRQHKPLPGKTNIIRTPVEPMSNASIVHRDLLLSKLSRGGTNDLDLGNASNHEYTRFQITDQTEKKMKTLRLLLKAKSLFMRKVCRTLVRQLDALAFNDELWVGEYGAENKYSLRKVTSGKFSIRVNYSANDPVMNLVNLETAKVQKGLGFSDDFTGRETMGVEDWDKEVRQRNLEALEKGDPIIALFNVVLDLIEDERDEEAKIEEARLLPMIKQLAMSGQMNPNLMGAMQQQGRPQGQPQEG